MLSNLILKDFIITKKLWFIVPIYILLFSFSDFTFSPIQLLIPLFTYLFLMQSVAYDDKNNSNILLASFPIKKNYLVLSKYLSYNVFSVIISILLLTINFIFKFYSVNLIEILLSLFALSIISNIYLPIYFKIGYIKSKYLNLSFIVLVLLIGTLDKLNIMSNSNSGPPEFISNPLNYLTSLPETTTSIYIIILYFIISFTSYFISNTLFKNRDI